MLIQILLNRAFPIMAIAGLLLAAWGLIVTPDEIKSDAQMAFRGTKVSSLNIETTTWAP